MQQEKPELYKNRWGQLWFLNGLPDALNCYSEMEPQKQSRKISTEQLRVCETPHRINRQCNLVHNSYVQLEVNGLPKCKWLTASLSAHVAILAFIINRHAYLFVYKRWRLVSHWFVWLTGYCAVQQVSFISG